MGAAAACWSIRTKKGSSWSCWVEKSNFAPRVQYFQEEDKIPFLLGRQPTHSPSSAGRSRGAMGSGRRRAPAGAGLLSRQRSSAAPPQPCRGSGWGSRRGAGGAVLGQPGGAPGRAPGASGSQRRLLAAVGQHHDVPPETTRR